MIKVDAPTNLSTTDVTVAMHRLPGFDGATLHTWHCERLPGGGGECLGVWRVRGTAETDMGIRPWSIVLKGWSAPATDGQPSDWNWPLRELELYRSGLLDDLPGGLRAPRFFGDMEREDGSAWLWLEDVAGDRNDPWPLSRYGDIAFQLGQFNGSYLVDRPLPDHPFLSRDWLSKFVEPTADCMAIFQREIDHPHVQAAIPHDVALTFLRMWERRHTAYAVLHRLPKTFCHLDVFRRNIFDPVSPETSGTSTVIDWSFAGIAALGEELVPLVGASVGFMDVPVEDIDRLQNIALEAYIEGLGDAGWHGDPQLVHAGYHASIGLRYGVTPVRFTLPGVLAGVMPPEVVAMFGHPEDEVRTHWRAFDTWLAQQFREQVDIVI